MKNMYFSYVFQVVYQCHHGFTRIQPRGYIEGLEEISRRLRVGIERNDESGLGAYELCESLLEAMVIMIHD